MCVFVWLMCLSEGKWNNDGVGYHKYNQTAWLFRPKTDKSYHIFFSIFYKYFIILVVSDVRCYLSSHAVVECNVFLVPFLKKEANGEYVEFQEWPLCPSIWFMFVWVKMLTKVFIVHSGNMWPVISPARLSGKLSLFDVVNICFEIFITSLCHCVCNIDSTNKKSPFTL